MKCQTQNMCSWVVRKVVKVGVKPLFFRFMGHDCGVAFLFWGCILHCKCDFLLNKVSNCGGR